MRQAVAFPLALLGALRTRPPERLLIAPQDIRTSDPTVAADIAAGYFAFGGKIVNARNRSPFALPSAAAGELNEHWLRSLAGFGWLRHLRAADSVVGRRRGRALVDDFIAAYGRPSQTIVWEPRVSARRLLAWLSQSPVILDGADRDFYNRFMKALAAHRSALERHLSGGLVGEDRLLVTLALAEFGLCIQGTEALQRRGTDLLRAEIELQVLPDGGPVNRNPQALIDLLLDLLPLRQAYAARGVQVPPPILNAIDRMMPALRLFRHGDGTLALFNGMGVTAPELVATILAYDDARAQPIANAPYAGYQRLEEGRTIVLVDAGPPPPAIFSTRAHAGCLSFELSSGFGHIVVNCGAPEVDRGDARAASRTTAAHSTLVIDDTSSCRFASGEGLQRWLNHQILAGPTEVKAERQAVPGATAIVLSHDGYVARFGFVHRRTLTLANGGSRLSGRDELVEAGSRASGALPYVLRFHLHPTIRARATQDGRSVRLDMPGGEGWLFEASLPAATEPSILFAAAGAPRPTLQIVVAATADEHRSIDWAFQRIVEGTRAPR